MNCNVFTARLLKFYLPRFADINQPESITGLYLVTDYYPINLHKLIYDSDVTLSVDQVVVLTYNLLCAVHYLHSANIIHRDLKLDNILITKDLQVKICDFGFSRCLKNRNVRQPRRSMSLNCFPRFYRPPEVILRQKDYDNRADLWSLGVVLSQLFQRLVTKEVILPFIGDSCFPASPLIQDEDEDENDANSKVQISTNDQLRVICNSLSISTSDLDFLVG